MSHVGRPDNWYHANNQYDLMNDDAIRAADADIDFRQFDSDGDRQLTPDEILVTIVKPQASTDGNWGGVWANVTVDGVAMDNYTAATHLDPVHKLQSGCSVPDVIETTTLARSLTMRAVEVGGEAVLVYDPARETELFVIEHRWPDVSNYDGFETSALGVGGVAVWRVELDPARRAWEPTGRPRVQAVALDVAGESLMVSWSDGTAAFRITARSNAPAPGMTIDLAAP